MIPSPPPAIPDALGIVNNPDLAYESLNGAITWAYGAIAWHAQAVVEPEWGGRPTGQRPTWFGIAPYASREVGRGLVAAATAVNGLEEIGAAHHLGAAFHLADHESVMATAFVLRMSGAHTAPPGNLAAFVDPRLLAVTAARLVAILRAAPDAHLAARLERVARTARNLLTDGNRRIFGDIGPAAVSWLRWRDGDPSPLDVIENLRLHPHDDGDEIARVYDRVRTAVDHGVPLSRFDGVSGGAPLLVPAFALYEAARREPARRATLITAANNLCAWQEQHISVQPAFTPTSRRDDEVDRAALFGVLTATVQLPIPRRKWQFASWADQHLARRDLNPLTPRVTEYNWSAFEDRWTPILGSFEHVYQRPDDVWPPPPGDPHAPDDRCV
jgi:hypothetical protein